MACADPAALVAQQQKSRKGRCLRSLAVWAGFALAAALCLQGTVLADTDWSRLGGASGVLASIGRYLQLDLALIPEFVIPTRSEEHTSVLQSLMRISYPLFCL